MAIKSILFNTEMVRAILDGRKTVTRRVAKPQPAQKICFHAATDKWFYCNGMDVQDECKRPYQPGDILYVWETWTKGKIDCGDEPGKTAEPFVSQCVGDNNYIFKEYCVSNQIVIDDVLWHPSIHMPKEAARIFLRVTGVRVERLQDITEEGVIAEGTDIDAWYEHDEWQHSVGDGCVRDGIPVVFETLKGFFGHTVWDSTMNSLEAYEKYGWEANPWVWVIEFERISREEAGL